MKRRIITALCLLPVLLIVSGLGAYNLDILLSGQNAYAWQPNVIVVGIMEDQRILYFFLMFTAVSVLLLLAALMSGAGSIRYHTSTVQLPNGQQIPCAAGNGEYGTAKFMSEREMKHTFALLPVKKQIKALKKGGIT